YVKLLDDKGKPVLDRNGDPVIVPDHAHPEHVRAVQFIFETYANRDLSYRDIARELQARGVPSPAGNAVWHANSVGNILRDAQYAGYYVFNRVREGRFYR